MLIINAEVHTMTGESGDKAFPGFIHTRGTVIDAVLFQKL
jgi:hypothetical protein